MRASASIQPTIVIFCTSLEVGNEPFDSTYYWEAYQDLLFALKDRGVQAYFATNNATYLGEGLFEVAYTTGIKVPSPQRLKPVSMVRADLVLERAESDPFIGTDITVVNPISIRTIANDKIATYHEFGTLQPESLVAQTLAELTHAINSMPGDRVVVKQPVSYGGKGVYIGAKADVLKEASEAAFPLLVQEFMDTSAGVPGFQSGVHDARVEICGGEITSYQVRNAKPGALHSNVSQGGEKAFLALERLPKELRTIVASIDLKFRGQPRYYSADFVHAPEGWKLIELNDYVGFDPISSYAKAPSDRGEASHKFGRLADYLVRAASANQLTSRRFANVVTQH